MKEYIATTAGSWTSRRLPLHERVDHRVHRPDRGLRGRDELLGDRLLEQLHVLTLYYRFDGIEIALRHGSI